MAATSTIKIRAKKLSQLRSVFDLAHVLKVPEHTLVLMGSKPRYRVYQIPKPKGGMRLVEDPEKALKKVQSHLNDFLQAAYYLIRPECAYGFTIACPGDQLRNIKTNAERHLNCKYLLNIDLKDFFHQVKVAHLVRLFNTHYPQFESELVSCLSNLLSYIGRLPMGAPTSPVLSNYAMLELDHALQNYCKSGGIVYTRYADDLSFSSTNMIQELDFMSIDSMIKDYGFEPNPNKIKWYEPKDKKEITGLVLGEHGIELQDGYLQRLYQEVLRYKIYLEVESRYRTGASLKKLKLFEQELRGKIQFATMILPENEELFNWLQIIEDATSVLENFESVDWLELPYSIY